MQSSEIQVIPYNHIVHQSDLNPGKVVEVQKPNSVDDFFSTYIRTYERKTLLLGEDSK